MSVSWRTRSGRARANLLSQIWRDHIFNTLVRDLTDTDGDHIVCFCQFKGVLASYRLTTKDNPSVQFLTELNILDTPGVSELERKNATDRMWKFLHCEADSIIFNDNSEDEDSDNSTDEGGSEGYSSMDEEE